MLISFLFVVKNEPLEISNLNESRKKPEIKSIIIIIKRNLGKSGAQENASRSNIKRNVFAIFQLIVPKYQKHYLRRQFKNVCSINIYLMQLLWLPVQFTFFFS